MKLTTSIAIKPSRYFFNLFCMFLIVKVDRICLGGHLVILLGEKEGILCLGPSGPNICSMDFCRRQAVSWHINQARVYGI